MDKSIMAMADDILGGALSNPSKAQSQLSNPYNEPELPELSDQLRESMMNQSVNEKLGPELKKFAKQEPRNNYPGDRGVQTGVSRDAEKSNLSPKAQAKLKSHRGRKYSRDDRGTSGFVDRPQAHQKARWQAQGDREKAHAARRGVKTRGTTPTPTTPSPANRMAMLKKKREAEEKRRRSKGIQKRKQLTFKGMESLEILLQARDILREMTSVGTIGVGAQVVGQRAFSTHGADMGKDTVKIEPVDKALRKTEKGKAKKKKKVKKESFELFLDAILNETQEIK
ncbi:MAG: hypothetical protein NWE76_10445 [Candidatus Bathyarchaeota archaeon]|nr:hypothetical protein [Candidatus Bathyarchaeota archaeon]